MLRLLNDSMQWVGDLPVSHSGDIHLSLLQVGILYVLLFVVLSYLLSPCLLYTSSMEEVMKKFDDTKAWNLPVINEEGKYKGFVSKPLYHQTSSRCV